LSAWYQTWWFKLTEAMAALLAVFIVVNARTRYLRYQRRHLERVVAERTEELQHANRAKSAFLAVMSHEIRTPMNAISGLTELLTLQTRSPEHGRMLTLIQHSTRDLLRIINDILDYSK